MYNQVYNHSIVSSPCLKQGIVHVSAISKVWHLWQPRQSGWGCSRLRARGGARTTGWNLTLACGQSCINLYFISLINYISICMYIRILCKLQIINYILYILCYTLYIIHYILYIIYYIYIMLHMHMIYAYIYVYIYIIIILHDILYDMNNMI